MKKKEECISYVLPCPRLTTTYGVLIFLVLFEREGKEKTYIMQCMQTTRLETTNNEDGMLSNVRKSKFQPFVINSLLIYLRKMLSFTHNFHHSNFSHEFNSNSELR